MSDSVGRNIGRDVIAVVEGEKRDRIDEIDKMELLDNIK